MLRLTDLHFAQLGGTYDGNLLYNTKSSLLRGQATVVNGDIAACSRSRPCRYRILPAS